MRNRPRLVLALAALSAAPVLSGAAPAGVDVRVDITDVRSAKGMVLACMTRQPEYFPNCQQDPDRYARKVQAASAVTVEFGHVAPGHYAIAVLHDENGNGKVDRVLGLMPKEGYGFSRDAPVKMGPPKFEKAAFDVGDVTVSQPIRMRYMF